MSGHKRTSGPFILVQSISFFLSFFKLLCPYLTVNLLGFIKQGEKGKVNFAAQANILIETHQGINSHIGRQKYSTDKMPPNKGSVMIHWH